MKLDFIETGAPACPLLRLAYADPATVTQLIQVLRRVGPTPVALDGAAGVEPVSGVRLHVSEGKADLGVRRVENESFSWVMDHEGWLQVIDLLAPFAEPKTSGNGFQYLSQGGVAVIISTDGHW
ncbi:hypothetical protein [Anaeromyxobacter oryzae]|uniref:Uncharacterized protein n=1 Tax=Anaeromyxobacter oryzae TaxID=2918170 RepID=A0ABM7WSQ1_9BACT|nr:hypothetical protein [Anaeromyxobacter oryzae]BDG02510.1 hypothetical protein AMOR_15060 [Anaeromyxobacter oryzae]